MARTSNPSFIMWTCSSAVQIANGRPAFTFSFAT
ncbi:uncharacterized protein G2W53_010982 [Senna tora]|uniref:Uncharacterized protein n=1 Tax=Senna tora TaxID=362788 RepID=A0A834X0I7_9FABA|nr:uncharacterized protein G2W53_010982 [Senna tora]